MTSQPTSPASRFIDKHEVMADLHWSESTLWRRIRSGDYPAPIKAGPGPTARNLWLRSAHERYVDQLIAGHSSDAA